MAKCPNRAASIASRKTRPGRGLQPRPDTSKALTALARAWVVTFVATALLSAALAISPRWDSAIFMQALRQALSDDPQLMMVPDQAVLDAAANHEGNSTITQRNKPDEEGLR
jgi:hypothetical protein